jgi:glutamate dehydrogenase
MTLTTSPTSASLSATLISTQEQKAAERLTEVRARLDDQIGPAASAFLDAYFHQLEPEDVLNRTVEGLVGAALSLWRFAEIRKPGTTKVKVFNPKLAEHGWAISHSVAQIVTDDMPFLVDSVAGCLASLDLELHLFSHPIAAVTRDDQGRRLAEGAGALRESCMHVEFDQQIAPARLAEIEARLTQTLEDVRAAVGDWRAMLAKFAEARDGLLTHKPPIAEADLAEVVDFLDWAGDNHFTFLGARNYNLVGDAGDETADLEPDGASGLGVLRDPAVRIIRRSHDQDPYSTEILTFLKGPDPLIITKANRRSTVHRTVHMDYIGVKQFDAQGRVIGERRFVGLFTSSAYNRSPFDVPILRRRVRAVIEGAGFAPASHNGKALVHILESYPRDELFQLTDSELLTTALGILRLEQRPRTKLFLRRDRFERYMSALVYVPRERYDTALRVKIGDVLADAFAGSVSAYFPSFGESALVRVHFIIRTTPGQIPVIDIDRLEERLRMIVRTWRDELAEALRETYGEAVGNAKFLRFGAAFPAAYREHVPPRHALADIAKIEALDERAASEGDGAITVDLYCRLGDREDTARFKLFRRGEPVPLSDCLPELEDLGLKVIAEEPYSVKPGAEKPIWIHDFEVANADGRAFDLARAKQNFETAFDRVWAGEMESDGFNRLIMGASLDWRQISLLRAIAKYLRQTGIAYSLSYMADTMAAQTTLSQLLVSLFETRFDPKLASPERGQAVAKIEEDIESALADVLSLDEDRILRRYRNVIDAMLRTNYFQRRADGGFMPTIAFKLQSAKVEDLPLPHPFVEIFVYSPRVEGVHLRGGPVARGGLRWSDRREDFRTEVLGLMKAQQVKNAVIVPVGAKGGFFPKRLPSEGRDAIQAEGVAAYKLFVSSLLELSDNRVGNKIVAPADTLRLDGDDPYLVVAADKGTATFSDYANGLSQERGFWLGDAFASGGSAGYDHKKMAITARGAWEAVKRHFREMDRDIQTQSFTVIGVGDMSGDVFGNGMLLSPAIRLIAAFDHRHIFFDPDPDPSVSHAERLRLFNLPRSSWDDYDKSLISSGGGIFPRALKAMPINAQLRAITGIESETATPAEVIRALLTAEIDLLWFGGIGTYVKASAERHADVGDRASDSLRVDADRLRAKVVGEGANLGCTQRGRIEFARKGGRINTDAIDNSAGVDCSDHEVNIKILLEGVVRAGDMTIKQRDALLVQMTDDVARLVLRDNYLQSLALSLAELRGATANERQSSYMRRLERLGRLDRALEALPDDRAIKALQDQGKGLTRPELAVLMAYAKLHLFDEVIATDLPDQPELEAELFGYFPPVLVERYADEIRGHGLRREIITTVLANELVNKGGPTFVAGIADELGARFADVAAAFRIAHEVFRIDRLWAQIDALDNQVTAAIQAQLYATLREILRRQTLWFLREGERPLRVGAMISAYQPGIDALVDLARSAATARSDAQTWINAGVGADLASAVAGLGELSAAGDIVDIARRNNMDTARVAAVHLALGRALGIDRLSRAAELIHPTDQWTRLALRAVIDDLAGHQRHLTAAVVGSGPGEPAQLVADFVAARAERLEPLAQLIADVEASGAGIAQLAVANRHLRELIPK